MDATEHRSFTLDFDLPHAPPKVWRTLTEPELLAKWMNMANDMKAVVGAKCTFRTEASQWWDGIVQCEVLELELHRRLRVTWKGGPLDTIVTWTLTPTDAGGTLLRLVHSGFDAKAGQAENGAKLGWQSKIKNLRSELDALS